MREVDSFKTRTAKQEGQMKQSEQILKKIGQIKDSISPFNSNTKMSDAHEKWYRYLPAENMRSLHSYHSREEQHPDNYRLSLERRLETLFREEKDILKERHYANSISRSAQNKEQRSQTHSNTAIGVRNLNQSTFEQMERKIRQLQQKYRQQDRRVVSTKAVKQAHWKLQSQQSDYKKQTLKAGANTLKERERGHSSYVKESREALHQTIEDCAERQKNLQAEMDLLKQSVTQIKKSNEEVLLKLNRRDEKRKNKHRTKELLLNILHKLEFMNVEITHAKKRKLKQDIPHISKIENQAEQLLREFQVLKVQYRHLDEERKKVEEKQATFQTKLQTIVDRK